jgi:hypothetical protein
MHVGPPKNVSTEVEDLHEGWFRPQKSILWANSALENHQFDTQKLVFGPSATNTRA